MLDVARVACAGVGLHTGVIPDDYPNTVARNSISPSTIVTAQRLAMMYAFLLPDPPSVV
jgi:hypothetical protein